MLRELASNQAKWGWGSGAQEALISILSNDFQSVSIFAKVLHSSVFLK
jgi:hypothetical protein